jgi:hypothetical protein
VDAAAKRKVQFQAIADWFAAAPAPYTKELSMIFGDFNSLRTGTELAAIDAWPIAIPEVVPAGASMISTKTDIAVIDQFALSVALDAKRVGAPKIIAFDEDPAIPGVDGAVWKGLSDHRPVVLQLDL